MKNKVVVGILLITVLFSCKKEEKEQINGNILDHNPQIEVLKGSHPQTGYPLMFSDTVITDSLFGVGVRLTKNTKTNEKLTRFKAYIRVLGYDYDQYDEPVYYMIENIAFIDSTILADEFTMYFDGYYCEKPNSLLLYLFFVYDAGNLNNSVNMKLFCDEYPAFEVILPEDYLADFVEGL